MKDFSINIAEDGGTIQVGDKTYQVTLITPAEPKPETPEPTLTVPDSVEFIEWGGSFALRYNGLVLSGEEQKFILESGLDYLDSEKNLKLIPCKLEEVKNGEWVVNEERKHKSFHYRLKTEKGWVSFNGSGEYPIIIDSGLSDSINWLKVVQG